MAISDRMAAMVGGRRKDEPGAGLHEPEPTGGEGEDAGGQTTITHHKDGTHSVQHHDGTETGPHDHLHEAFAHISMKHHPDEAHSHIMHEQDDTHTSHHAKDGEVTGPHDHENLEALHSHLKTFLNEEAGEGEHEGADGYLGARA